MALLYWMLIILSILASVYFWRTSHVFRYYVKIWYYHGVLFMTGIVVFPIALLRPRNVSNIRPIQKFWNFSFSLLGIKIEQRNAEILEQEQGPAIIVLNHQSSMDVIGFMQVSPRRATWLAKKEILYIGTFGISCWLCGLIFIDRLNQEKARGTMKKTAKTILDQKLKLWIFPEGTRHLSNTFLPFRKGAFNLAVQAQIPIYPVVLSTFKQLWDPKKKILNTGNMIASCLPPIQTKGLTSDDVTRLSEDIRQQMLDEFHKINEELEWDAKKHGRPLLGD